MGLFHHINLSIMVRYAAQGHDAETTAQARGHHVRVSFKNTRETAMAIKGMKIKRAEAYLKNCLEHKEIIPYRRFKGDVGRKAQCKAFKGGVTQGRWPKAAIEHVAAILKNATSNAVAKDLDESELKVLNVCVQRAPKMRRRTYRAHGRINAYKSSPHHIEMIIGTGSETVPKPDQVDAEDDDVPELV